MTVRILTVPEDRGDRAHISPQEPEFWTPRQTWPESPNEDAHLQLVRRVQSKEARLPPL
jgi:hypothetical protein